MVVMPNYPIETARLRLRPFTRGDVDAVFAYRSREDVCRFLFDEPMSRDAVAETVQARISQVGFEQEGDKIVLAVEARERTGVIGEVSLIWRSDADRQGELGYIFNPAVQGRGFATEAALALLAFGFGPAGLHRIYARCDARNLASARVMEKLGMRREAHFREHVMVKGVWDEELWYAMLEGDWRARKCQGPNAATV